MMKSLVVVVLVVSLFGAGCSGSGNQASTCEEIADQTVALIQDLIDDVDAEAGSMSIEDFTGNGDNLPSIESFKEQSEAIDTRAAELGCTPAQVGPEVASRVGDLTAETPLGRLVINLLVAGNL